MIARYARVVAAATIFLAAPASADTALRSLRTADEGRGWEAVGRLDVGGGGFCTGALIAPDVVLTAAHCVVAAATGAPVDPAALAFRAGLRLGRPEASRGVRRVVVHPGYDPAASGAVGGVGHDLALLELDAPIRLNHVRPFAIGPAIGPGAAVEVVSYARDRADAPSREAGCAVLTRDATVLVLSCAVDADASGSPVLTRVGGEARIVSVVSSMARWNGRAVALAPVLDGALDEVLAVYARTPAAAPVGKRLVAGAPRMGIAVPVTR